MTEIKTAKIIILGRREVDNIISSANAFLWIDEADWTFRDWDEEREREIDQLEADVKVAFSNALNIDVARFYFDIASNAFIIICKQGK